MRMAFVSLGDRKFPPSSKIRTFGVGEHLREEGYEIDFFPGVFPRDYPDSPLEKLLIFLRRLGSRLGDLYRLRKYDVIYVNKQIFPYRFPPLFFRFLKQVLGKTVIFDTCDPIWEGRESEFHPILEMSDAVVVSGQELKEYVEDYNENSQIIPMSVDTEFFHPADTGDEDDVVIGWLGSGPRYKDYLRKLIDPLESLSEGHDIRFHLISAQEDEELHSMFKSADFPTKLFDWVPEEELVEEINRFDIGVVPLLENNWAKGKSPIKILEYSACGIPVVCSDIGDAKNMIQKEEDGFLVRGKKEWYERLKKLVRNKKLRKNMGKVARKKAESEYSYKANAEKLKKIIEEVYEEYEN